MTDNWNLQEHLCLLLKKEEIVVIPHFGAFVSDYESAKIQDLAILPPQKKIIFNKNVIKDDGVLNQWVSEVLQQEYLHSKLTIAEAVYGWRKSLAYGDQLKFKNIGDLKLNSEGQIIFEASNNSELQSEFFGLEPVKVSKVIEEPKTLQLEPPVEEPKLASIEVKEEKKVIPLNAPKTEEKKETKVIDIASPKKKKTALGKIAMVLAPFVCIGIGVVGASKMDKENNLASLFSSNKVENIETTDTPDITVNKVYAAEDFFTKEEIDLLKVKENNKIEAEIDKTEVSMEAKESIQIKNYHVIAGCFSDIRNAKKLKAQLKSEGYSAELIGKTKKGLHRVSFGSYNSKKEALLSLAKVKLEKNKASWLLNESVQITSFPE